MRTDVQVLVADGPLPDRDSIEEPHAPASCFGPDDCYGVGRPLIHLIETAPGPRPVIPRPSADTP